MVAAAMTWLHNGERTAGDIFCYKTDSKNCYFLARKMRSKVAAVDALWLKLAKEFDERNVFIHVIWHSRESANAKLCDALSRCIPVQDFVRLTGNSDVKRYTIQDSVRALIRA